MGVDILDILSYSIGCYPIDILGCSYLITLYYYINENCLPQVECKHHESRGCHVLGVFSFETGCHCVYSFICLDLSAYRVLNIKAFSKKPCRDCLDHFCIASVTQQVLDVYLM